MSVLHVTYDDQLIHHALQEVIDNGTGGFFLSCTLVNGNLSILVNDTVVAVGSYTLFKGSCFIIEELNSSWCFHTVSFVAIGTRINIPQHSIVRRKNQTILRVHREQVGQEVQLVDGPVDDVHHCGVGQGRICHRCELCRGVNAVHHINHTVTAHETGIYIFNADAHFNLGIVQHLVELRGDSLREHVTHVDVDELCYRSLGDTVNIAILCLEVLTFILPPVFQSLVGRNEHGTSVIVHIGITRSTDVLVPSRIEFQLGIDSLAVWRCGVGTTSGIVTVIAEYIDRVLVVIQTVVLSCTLGSIIRCAETVEQFCPARHVRMHVYNVCHVG